MRMLTRPAASMSSLDGYGLDSAGPPGVLGNGIGGCPGQSTSHRLIESRPFEIVKDDLTQRFGGVTTYTRSPAERRWRGDRTHIDDVVVFEVLCNDIDRHWWNVYGSGLTTTSGSSRSSSGPNPHCCSEL